MGYEEIEAMSAINDKVDAVGDMVSGIEEQLKILNKLKAAELQLKYNAAGSELLNDDIRELIQELALKDVES
jgi:hypothetical protein